MSAARTVRVVATHDFCCSYSPTKTSYGSLPGGEGLKSAVEAMREDLSTVWADAGDFAAPGALARLHSGWRSGQRGAAGLGVHGVARTLDGVGYGRGGPRGRGLVGAGRTGRGRSRSRGARSGPPRTPATDGDRATRRRPGSAALARCRYKPPKIGQPPTGRVLCSQPGRGWCRGRDRKARRRRRPVLWKHKRHNRRSRVHHLPCGQ